MQPGPAAKTGGGQVALYPMAGYTCDLRKPGAYHVIRLDWLIPEPHRHDFFEIIWVRQGQGEVQSDFRTYPVRPRTLFFSAPGQVHAWRPVGRARGHIASFSAEFFGVNHEDPGLLGRMPFFYQGAVDPVLHLNPSEARRIDQVFRHLTTEGATPGPGRDDLVRAYLTILLTHARQIYGRHHRGDAPVPDLLSRRFRLALETHFPRLREVRDYAELLGVSRTHLNDHLQRNLGRAASAIIEEHTVIEAKRLLLHTTLTSAQIAYRLQFQDPSHFGRFFRRCSGCTPGEYRSRTVSDFLAG